MDLKLLLLYSLTSNPNQMHLVLQGEDYKYGFSVAQIYNHFVKTDQSVCISCYINKL